MLTFKDYSEIIVKTEKWDIDTEIKIEIDYSFNSQNAFISVNIDDTLYQKMLLCATDTKIERTISKIINKYHFNCIDDFAIVVRFNSDDYDLHTYFVNNNKLIEKEQYLFNCLNNSINRTNI